MFHNSLGSGLYYCAVFFSVTFAFMKAWISIYTFYFFFLHTYIHVSIYVQLYIHVYKESSSLFISTVQTIVHQSRCCSIILIGNLVHKNAIIPFSILLFYLESEGMDAYFLGKSKKCRMNTGKTFAVSYQLSFHFSKSKRQVTEI